MAGRRSQDAGVPLATSGAVGCRIAGTYVPEWKSWFRLGSVLPRGSGTGRRAYTSECPPVFPFVPQFFGTLALAPRRIAAPVAAGAMGSRITAEHRADDTRPPSPATASACPQLAGFDAGASARGDSSPSYLRLCAPDQLAHDCASRLAFSPFCGCQGLLHFVACWGENCR